MNCRSFDAFKCLLLFKQKRKPRSEFWGGFLNKNDCLSLVCTSYFIMKPQNKTYNHWNVPKHLNTQNSWCMTILNCVMWKMNIFWDLENSNEYIINSEIEILFKAAHQNRLRQLWNFQCNSSFTTGYHFWRSTALYFVEIVI